MIKKRKVTLEQIARVVERGFSAVADDMTKLATKEDIARLGERLLSIEQELKDIKRRLTSLEDKFEKHREWNKDEIEQLWKRVVAIEKQLKMHR